MKNLTRRAILASLVLAGVIPAAAQEKFPARTIRFILPYGVGSTSDYAVRLLGDRLAKRLGVSVVVENRPGGNLVIAAEALLQSHADGYTIGMLAGGHAIGKTLFPSVLRFDPARDFQPVTLFAEFGSVIATANPRYRTLGDFIAAARAEPGKRNVGTMTVGSPDYLSAHMLMAKTGINFEIIPYREVSDMVTGSLQRSADVIIQGYGALEGPLKDGKLRALAVTTQERAPHMPEVPTVEESGIADFEAKSWVGFYVPLGTPSGVVAFLNWATHEAMRDPGLVEPLGKLGIRLRPTTPEGLGRFMASEIEKWAAVIKAAGIKPQ